MTRRQADKALDKARALAHHEAGSGKRRVSRYGRLANPSTADPARGSFTPASRRERRGRR